LIELLKCYFKVGDTNAALTVSIGIKGGSLINYPDTFLKNPRNGVLFTEVLST
jgi:hypothetical protein